jgi:hypothetical protein
LDVFPHVFEQSGKLLRFYGKKHDFGVAQPLPEKVAGCHAVELLEAFELAEVMVVHLNFVCGVAARNPAGDKSVCHVAAAEHGYNGIIHLKSFYLVETCAF